MRIYHIQRGNFKEKINISAIEGVDSILKFDYMGSSEFEFGALPKSLKEMVSSFRNNDFNENIIMINNKKFCLYSKSGEKAEYEEIIEFLKSKALNEYNRDTKECMYFLNHFEGKEKTKLKRGCAKKTEKVPNYSYHDFWWDIDNDWVLFPQEFSRIFKIALKKLEEKGFGK